MLKGEKMSENQDKRLAHDQKEAINSYLLKLSAFIGIPNLLFLIVSFGYIAFILPNQAIQQAKIIMESQITSMNQTLITLTAKTLEKSGGAQALTKQAEERILKLTNDLKKLDANVEAMKNADVNQIGKIINEITKNEAVCNAADFLSRLKKLENTVFQFIEKNPPTPTYRVVSVRNDDVLNIRSQPGISSSITGSIPYNSKGIKIIGKAVNIEDDVWIPIMHEDIEGWVNFKYLDTERSPNQDRTPHH